jgi:hypothetical protein
MTPPGPVKLAFGRTLWRYLHGIADHWPCDRCRPGISEWMSGLHDAVNVRLGKRPFRPASYDRFREGSLEGGVHLSCGGCRMFRLFSRLLARVPLPRRYDSRARIVSASAEWIDRKP